jgi:hypothetical protein
MVGWRPDSVVADRDLQFTVTLARATVQWAAVGGVGMLTDIANGLLPDAQRGEVYRGGQHERFARGLNLDAQVVGLLPLGRARLAATRPLSSRIGGRRPYAISRV